MERDFHVRTARASARQRKDDAAALQPGNVRPPTLLSLPSYLAGNVSRVGHRLLLRALEEEGLLLSHHAVLAALRDFGPLAQHEMADRLDVDRSQVVGFVDRLEAKGLVTRTRDADDRRRVVIALTTDGRKAERRITSAARRSQADLMGTLSTSEQEHLLTLLRRVLDAHDAARLGLTDS
jgi:DNA-binding MarR family transcriptional regulator